MSYVLIALGAAIGAPLRYVVVERLVGLQPGNGFPVGTTMVNLTGCFLIGVAGALAEESDFLSRDARLFIIVGLLGGYTTFSTFGWETVSLLRDNQVAPAIQYVLVSNIGGIILVWVGLVATRGVWSR